MPLAAALLLPPLLVLGACAGPLGAGGTGGPGDPGATPGSVPVSFERTPDGGGRFYPIVEVRVGSSSSSYRVILDTGSHGLVMTTGLEGTSATGGRYSVDYVGVSAEGPLTTAAFSIGGHTASRVALLEADCPGGCVWDGLSDIDGVLGIGQGYTSVPAGEASIDFYSPLRQLDVAAERAGHTLDFGPDTGILSLGAPQLPGATALSADPHTSPGDPRSYPDGVPVYDREVELCWAVGEGSQCTTTMIDSGAPSGMIAGDQFAPVTRTVPVTGDDPQTRLGTVRPGTPVAVATPDGTSPFLEWTADDSTHELVVYNSIDDGDFNTGNAFFVGRSVGYDNGTGRILVGGATAG
ncbi:hypothetical protein [Compostimonas suwonensis]|uniref:Aspartyl protease n=1 Tax=Compostimonas suwonensis TaxID=1048394 RepID=A0A2M9C4D7_9MICO|nr:hypothetical protein [Compostimonas suwonensis]PJJ65394.1 hypothetical protein CLV54_0427 [Compostimonas suwonensis]